ncbi:MAG: DEAD/DEAH box helicase, partial [Anaerovoracaceae bacterium]
KSLVRDFKTVGDSDYEVPESLQDIMRNYQKFGYRWLRTVEACGFGGILADDMGLGKTLQVIAVILASKLESPDDQGTALIVTPASLVYNWQEEFAKFAPQLDVCVITGTKTERKSKLRNYHQHDVLITSYDLLKRDILEYEDLGFTYQVIDEAQSIKNHTTAAAKAVKVINSRVRFALTGTPIENRLSELWSIFDYLMPGFLYSYDRFRRELEHPITKNEDETAMEQLKRMVEPFILRRLKSEVLQDLPDKIEEVQYVGFEKAQQQLYDGQAIRMKQMLGEQSEENYMKSKIRILAELTRIRQICCDPSLCFEDYSGGSAKREACMELIRSAIDGEHKMLVFSQFTSMLELLEADLAKENIQYYKITGSTKKEDRTDLVRRFNEDSTPVFLISLKAGGTGLNLTGADIVIHYDPWWNLAAQNQATDRAHRIGQEKTVSVYKLIAKGSIEEKILRMQEDKKALADEILSGETGGLMNMSREDLMELL